MAKTKKNQKPALTLGQKEKAIRNLLHSQAHEAGLLIEEIRVSGAWKFGYDRFGQYCEHRLGITISLANKLIKCAKALDIVNPLLKDAGLKKAKTIHEAELWARAVDTGVHHATVARLSRMSDDDGSYDRVMLKVAVGTEVQAMVDAAVGPRILTNLQVSEETRKRVGRKAKPMQNKEDMADNAYLLRELNKVRSQLRQVNKRWDPVAKAVRNHLGTQATDDEAAEYVLSLLNS